MKSKLRVMCSGILCMSLFFGTKGIYAKGFFSTDLIKGMEIPINEVTYDTEIWEHEDGNIEYPVTENSDEWASFETHDEMVAACNIPEELLEKMSTEELVDLMLDYPLLGDLRLYENLNEGFYCLSQKSNVLAEILKREDGSQALLVAYDNLELIKENSEIDNMLEEVNEKSNSCLDIVNDVKYSETIEEISDSLKEDTFLEVALAQDDVIENLNETELEVLSYVANEKVEEKANSNIYSACATIIYDVAEENDCSEEFDDVVRIETNDVSSDKVVGNSYSTTVKTPKGSKVTVSVNDYYGIANELADAKYVKTYYPKAKIVAPATNQYNCHSYAWYKQSTTNKYWMNNPGKYMTDGSYARVGSKPTATGQKVCYIQYPLTNPYIHSGIVYSIKGSTIKIKSKWGSCPLVIHNVKYSPYGGTPTYYKKK